MSILLDQAKDSIKVFKPNNLPMQSISTLGKTTASSGLAITYTTGPVKVSGNTLTLTGTGTVNIRAHQDGNADYLSAPTVLRTFTVTKAP